MPRERRARRAIVSSCVLALALSATSDASAASADARAVNTHGATSADVLARFDARARAETSTTGAMDDVNALEAAVAAAVEVREAREAFEAFAARDGRRAAYCARAEAYPCAESERRWEIFRENYGVVIALDRAAAAGLGSRGRRGGGGEGEVGTSSRARYGTTLWSDKTRDEFSSSVGRLAPSSDDERRRSSEKRDGWKRMHEEFLRRNEDIWKNERSADGELFDASNLPKRWDWRDYGGVSQVWEQGACGGCWAFTTAAAVEGVHFIWTKESVTLSPQMLLECDPIDQDCTGGNMVTGYQYAVMKGGISGAGDYPVHPYTLKSSAVGPCRTNTARKHAASIDDYIILDNTWEDLKSAIYMQPISVAVNALGENFRFYSGGILTYDECQPDFERSPNLINHAVVAVGYGHDDELDLDYVIIKNSWGENWGEKGYARIAIQGEPFNATCGLLIESVAPLKLSNLTYADPDYIDGLNDYVDWAPRTELSTTDGILYIILTAVVLVAALSFAILSIISCTSEDDGYYYTDLDYDEYDKHFDVRKQTFGKDRDLTGLTASRERSRFDARGEPITGLHIARSGRDVRDASKHDIKSIREGL